MPKARPDGYSVSITLPVAVVERIDEMKQALGAELGVKLTRAQALQILMRRRDDGAGEGR